MWHRFPLVAAVATSLLVGFEGIVPQFEVKPAAAAEQIQLYYGALDFSLPIKSLETFAATGTIDSDFRFYARSLDQTALAQLRLLLQRRFKVSHVAINQLSYTGMGEKLLQDLGRVIQTETGDNGFYALRGALTLAANDPKGMSVLGVLQRYPSRNIRVSLAGLLKIQRYLTTVIEYRDAAVVAIDAEANQEAQAQPTPNFLQLADLRKPGTYRSSKRTITVNSQSFASVITGKPVARNFPVDIYLPQGLKQPAPVVVISHGLGSKRQDLIFLTQHLVSHGFVVVVPEHIGSNTQAQQELLEGALYGDINPAEFVDRPRDVQRSLDALEKLAKTDLALRKQVNLQQVGVIGHSFGGYTALALAGAELNITRLKQTCTDDSVYVNPSLLLQCRASDLPQTGYTLRDPRIKAAIAINPVAGFVFDPKGVRKIQVPMMIVSGTDDFIAPPITEQIHPFVWLTTKERYLVAMKPASHNSFYPQGAAQPRSALGNLLLGPDPIKGSQYVKALSLAMMQTHVAKRSNYMPYLNSAYAKYLSQAPLTLQLVKSLTPAQLEQAFGSKPPIAVIPN